MIVGHVRHADGRPAHGARVFALPTWLASAGSYQVMDRAGPDGKFRLGPLPSREWVVGAAESAADFPPWPERGSGWAILEVGRTGVPPRIVPHIFYSSWTLVTLEARGERAVDLALPVLAAIEGRVVDDDGRPQKADLKLSLDFNRLYALNIVDLQTDDEGRFRVDGLGPGPFRVSVRLGGTVFGLVPGKGEVIVRGRPSGSIEAILPPGIPTGAECQISLWRTDHFVGRVAPDLRVVRVRAPKETRDAEVRVFGALRAGTYRLHAWCSDGRVGAAEEVRLAEREARRGVRIEPRQPGRVEVQVVDFQTGQPIVAATVHMTEEDKALRRPRRTRLRGEAVVENAPPGEVLLRVGASNYSYHDWVSVLVTEGATTRAVIRLVRGADGWRFLPGDTGIVPVTRLGRPSVERVRPGSAADRAGVRAGDAIRAVDGKDVLDVAAFGVCRLLAGEPETDVAVTLGGASGEHTVTLKRELIPDPGSQTWLE